MEQLKKYSPVIFGFIIICFLLPFLNLSFEGQKVASMTGIQIVTDNVRLSDEYKDILGIDRNSANLEFPTGNLPILALIAALLGLVISYLKMSNKNFLNMLISIIGGVLLFMLKNQLDKKIISFFKGRFFIEFEFGYWVALLLFIVSAIIQGLLFNQERKMNSGK